MRALLDASCNITYVICNINRLGIVTNFTRPNYQNNSSYIYFFTKLINILAFLFNIITVTRINIFKLGNQKIQISSLFPHETDFNVFNRL